MKIETTKYIGAADVPSMTYDVLSKMTQAEFMDFLQIDGAREKVNELMSQEQERRHAEREPKFLNIEIANLTLRDIRNMPREQYKELLKSEEGQAKVTELLANRLNPPTETLAEVPAETPVETSAETPVEQTPEEIAAAEAARVAAEQAAAEAARLEAERVEAARKEAEANAEKARRESENKRFVIDFQATDEDGNPIGKKTHLEASSQEELTEKMRLSYVNAVRALDRAKKQKPVYRQPAPVQLTQAELDAAAADVASDDPQIRAAAIRKLAQAEVDKVRQAASQAEEKAIEAAAAYQFMRRHIADYNPCEANGKAINDYLKENNLAWTVDNLEIAFDNLQDQLAPVPAPTAPERVEEIAPSTAVNPAAAVAPAAPVVPAAPVAPVAPVVPAAPEPQPAPVVPPAAPNTPAAPARRAGVNGGIIPGQSSGAQPTKKASEFAFTKKDIAKMTAEEMRKRQKIDPTFYDKVNALFGKK